MHKCIYDRISESLAIKLNLYSFVWKGFSLPVKSTQIMWNHTGERNRRQPHDEWSYSDPSSAASFPSSAISAGTPGPRPANHNTEHGGHHSPGALHPFPTAALSGSGWQFVNDRRRQRRSAIFPVMSLLLPAPLKVLSSAFSFWSLLVFGWEEEGGKTSFERNL